MHKTMIIPTYGRPGCFGSVRAAFSTIDKTLESSIAIRNVNGGRLWSSFRSKTVVSSLRLYLSDLWSDLADATDR